MLGVIAMQVSPHGLAWLFLTITSTMVLLEGLSNPLQAVTVAYYRVFEVGDRRDVRHHRGQPAAGLACRPAAARRRDGAICSARNGPRCCTASRSAIAVVVVLWIWILIDLPQVTEMAITVAVVMAAPVVADGGLGTRHAIAVRSLHRFMGCLLGGIVALACLALDVTSFPWWLALIGASVWIGMHIQMGPHGVGYVGTQAAFVFIVTLIQGAGPPDQHHAGRRPLRRHRRRAGHPADRVAACCGRAIRNSRGEGRRTGLTRAARFAP